MSGQLLKGLEFSIQHLLQNTLFEALGPQHLTIKRMVLLRWRLYSPVGDRKTKFKLEKFKHLKIGWKSQ